MLRSPFRYEKRGLYAKPSSQMSQQFPVRAQSRVLTDWNWVSRGWNLFFEQWQMWLVNTALFLVAAVVSLLGFVPMWFWMMEAVEQGYANWLSPLPWIGLLVFFLGSGIAAFLYAGLYKCAERQLRGERIRVEDLFSAADRFPTLIGVQSIVFALVLIGTLFCFLPGLVVGGLMFFTTPAVVLGKRDVGEAINGSYRLMSADVPNLIIFGIVTNLIGGVGANICYVGLLASIPISVLITTVAYYDCAGLRPTNDGQTDS